MGTSMCGHLIDANYPMTVYSRTREHARPLLDKGAACAHTPAEVAASFNVIFTIQLAQRHLAHVRNWPPALDLVD